MATPRRVRHIRLPHDERALRAEDLRSLIAANDLPGAALAARAGVSLRTLRYFLSGAVPQAAVLLALEEAAEWMVQEKRRLARPPTMLGHTRLAELLTTMATATPAERGRRLHVQYLQAVADAMRATVGPHPLCGLLVQARIALEAGKYDLCISLASRVPSDAGEVWYAACWLQANALYLTKRWKEAIEIAQRGVNASTPSTAAWNHWMIAKSHDKLGRYQVARASLHQARRLAPAVTHDYERSCLEGWTDWALAWIALIQGELEEAAALFTYGSQVTPVEDYGLNIWFLHGAGKVQTFLGDFVQARQHFRDGAHLCLSMGNEHYLAWMQWGLAEIAAAQGAYVQARTLVDQVAERLNRSGGDAAPSRSSAVALGWLCRGAAGDRSWSYVADELAALRQAETKVEYSAAISTLLLFEAEARRQAGHLETAVEIFMTALERSKRKEQPFLRADALLGLGVTGCEQARRRRSGRYVLSRNAAVTHLRDALTLYERFGARWGILQAGLALRAEGERIRLDRLYPSADSFPIEAAALDLNTSEWTRVLTFPGPAG